MPRRKRINKRKKKITETVYIIDLRDYSDKQVLFSKKKWKIKCQLHPELKNKTFLENVRKTLKAPLEVWQDYDNPEEKQCYYKKYSTTSYVKVIVWIANHPYNIVSAFETNYIKETKYSELKRLV